MKFTMSYGHGDVSFELDPSRVMEVLEPGESNPLRDPAGAVKSCLENPTGTPPLSDMLKEKKPSRVAVIVNDITRPTPYDILLPPLLKTLGDAGIGRNGISFITATGIHDPHTAGQNRSVYGDFLADNYRIVSHDADSSDLVFMGKLSSGNDFYLNRYVYEADFVITLGVIAPHYFAGFSGGRKSILPGVSGRSTIEANHARMVDLVDHMPGLDKNPINLEMMEAARMAGVDFILNVVPDSSMNVVKVVAGDVEKAWYEGVKLSSEMFEIPLAEKADVTIVSSGGYPRDLNVYQAQKALDHADRATRDGGTVILLAECPAGLGEPVFEEWIRSASRPEDVIERIGREFALGGHKAFGIGKVAAKKDIILISDLTPETTESLFMKKACSIGEALDMTREKYGEDIAYILMPCGSLTVPKP